MNSQNDYYPAYWGRVYTFALFFISCFFLIYFYLFFLSFPVIGEDGAANYISMINALTTSSPFSANFNVKYFEGLGQVNLFYSPGYDPYTWVMYLPIDKIDAFRISYVIRSISCWIFTYFLTKKLFTGKNSSEISSSAATINTLLCFPLGLWLGVPSTAGIHHASQSAMLPLLCWLYLKTVEENRRFNSFKILLFFFILFFLLGYPINSLMGIAIFLLFAFATLLTAEKSQFKHNLYSFFTALSFTSLILFIPKYGIFYPWNKL